MKVRRKILSLLLIFAVMCISMAEYSAVMADNNSCDKNSSNVLQVETIDESVLEADKKISLEDNMLGKKEELILPDIVKTDLSAAQFVGRAKAKETNLNTFVFKNQDGTQTMKVYSYPVKYIDEKGKVQDISTEIKAKNDGGFETKANSIKTIFSKKLNDGILLQHKDVNIRLVSDKTTDATLSKDNQTVSYIYDNKTTIEYSLTYTGFKEDIVVSEYTGQTEYEFTIYTNGLALVKDNGSYFLKNSSSNIKATIGDVIIFTADEKNNAFGYMTHETITPNQEYIMTIHVDKAYLEDEQTKYPIRIDPTIEINYDNNGASAIEDVTINSNAGSSATSSSLSVGLRENYGISRALMKFPNLDLSDIASSSDIISVSVELRDLMCESEVLDIYCYPFTGSVWDDDTVSWSTVGYNSYGVLLSSNAMSYANGQNLNPSHRYSFDITNAVKGWKDGTLDLQKGIIFKASSNIENGTVYKARTLASYNRASNKPSFSMMFNPNISIHETETSVIEGNTITLTANTASGVTVTWSSSNPSIATIDENGVVSGVKVGSATITASVTKEDNTIASDTCMVYVTIENGEYFLQNKQSTYFADIKNKVMANGTVIHQWKFHGGNTQKWVFTYIGEGYYTIQSRNTSSSSSDMYYLGVLNDATTLNYDIVLRTGQITDGMKWKISVTSSGAYRLIPKNGESRNYALATSSSSAINGSRLMQGEYWANNSYCDEWYITSPNCSDVFLLGILDLVNEGHDHVSVYGDVMSYLNPLGYKFKVMISESASFSAVRTSMINSKIFVFRGHGGGGTSIQLGQTLANCLSASNIYDYILNKREMNLSNCDIMLFIACETANETGDSLIHAAVDAGATTAIGFKNTIKCSGANKWTEIFFEQYADHEVAYAAAYAARNIVISEYYDISLGIDSMEMIDTQED